VSEITRNNHYVPKWYQWGFLPPGQSQLHYLDLTEPKKVLPDGRVVPLKALHQWGPKKCFVEFDLYSTHFGNIVSDEIETHLFGSIDGRGAKAVRAFVDADLHAMHETFESFFEYLDAQRLRTPKGLDWIKSRYPSLDQHTLMQEMQELRFMHCTMWAEGVREIVSAQTSGVKFLVTDHPVTLYNAASPPSCPSCKYPGDPALEWMGTITLYPLNADTCLILTHLEYAKDPNITTLTQSRTNARYRGESMVRFDAFIRSRELSSAEVIAINHLLKSRARRYIAASKVEWLYPERSYAGTWEDMAGILLPRERELYQFGGEIYVKYEDGSVRYQDQFGRSSGGHEYLKRPDAKTVVGANDQCGCGGGLKYKHCCRSLPVSRRPTWSVLSIRERNLILCRAASRIMGLDAGKTWDDVRREISDDQIAEFHRVVGSVWPKDTDLLELLPKPRPGVVRALYLGPSDPQTVRLSATGWLPYFDEVVLANPFQNPFSVRPEYSAIDNPSQFKAQMIKNLFFLFDLEPFIASGQVHLIPDPADLDPNFMRSMLRMAKERTTGWEPPQECNGILEQLMRHDMQRFEMQRPIESLKAVARKAVPGIADADVEAVVERIRSNLVEDPVALLQDPFSGDAGGQLTYTKGYSLESGMYLAMLTGSILYADTDAFWDQLHLFACAPAEWQNPTWDPVNDALNSIELPIELHLGTLLSTFQEGRTGSFRPPLRRLIDTVRGSRICLVPAEIAKQLRTAARKVSGDWAGVSGGLRGVGKIRVSVPRNGFERNDVRRLLLTFGKGAEAHPVPLAMRVSVRGEARAKS
jgi:hypothetical protein